DRKRESDKKSVRPPARAERAEKTERHSERPSVRPERHESKTQRADSKAEAAARLTGKPPAARRANGKAEESVRSDAKHETRSSNGAGKHDVKEPKESKAGKAARTPDKHADAAESSNGAAATGRNSVAPRGGDENGARQSDRPRADSMG